VARPGLLGAAGIGGRGRSAENRLQREDPLVASTLVGTARPVFPEQLVEIKFVGKISPASRVIAERFAWRLRQLGLLSRRRPIVGADLVGSEAH
jgi:hypothetical protein